MSPNKPERTLYALTPSQGLTVMNRTWCIHRNVINIPTSIIVDAALDLGLLENAVRLAVGRWDSFGIRIIKNGRQWQQYFAEPALISLKRKDFRGRTRAEMEKFFHREARKVLPLADSPMAKIWIFTDPEGNSGLFSVINHLIMDSWAISNFYKDVLEVYQALVGGHTLPKAPVPYEGVLIKELAYLESDRYKADQEYWRQELTASEPLFASLKGSQELADYRKKRKLPNLRT
ncbi:MAG TPA: condensation domain-containing protein, partial [Dermatophilaceae bacterium]